MAELAPGSYLAEMELNPAIPPETLEVLRTRYDLDQGLAERYGAWLGSLFRGELGYSLAYGMPVGELLRPRLLNTLLLAGVAQVVLWALALTWGTWTAWRPGGWADRTAAVAGGLLLALPEILLALLALMAAARSGFFPVGGMRSLDWAELSWVGRVLDLLSHLALPVLVLVLAGLPMLLRHVHAAVSETLDQPYIRAARAYGCPPGRLLLRHALPAAAQPLVALFGLSVARLLSGSLLVEVIFGWPGLGPLLIEAILARDLYVVIGATLVSAVLVVLSQALTNVFQERLDPRLRSA